MDLINNLVPNSIPAGTYQHTINGSIVNGFRLCFISRYINKNFSLRMGLFKCPPKSFYPTIDPFYQSSLGLNFWVDHRMKGLDAHENTNIKHMIYAG